jgi:cytochrome P450
LWESSAGMAQPDALSQERLRTDPIAVLTELHAQPGDLITRQYGDRTVHYARAPERVEELLSKRHDSFVKLNQVMPGGDLDEHRGRLIVSEERDEHLAARKALATIIMQGDPLSSIRRSMERRMEQLVPSLPPVLELPGMALAITSEVTVDQLFESGSVDARRLTASFERAFAGETPFREKPEDDAELPPPEEDRLEQLIPQLAGGDGPVPNAFAELGERFGVSELERMIAVGGVYAAASETTARAVAWMLGVLAGDGELQSRVADEAAGGPIADAELLRSVVLETIRLYPPSWLIGRFAKEPTQLGDRPVDRHDVVLVCPYLMHRDPRYYEHPDAFRPERFLGSAPPRWAFIGFGGGRRQCVGERLALAEMETFAYYLLRSFRLNLPDPLPDPLPHLTLTPPPFRVALTAR